MDRQDARERGVDRRTLILGGAAAVGVAAVAPAVAAGAQAGAQGGPVMIAATVVANPAGGALEVVPISTDRRVQVEVSGAEPSGLAAGDTVAVFLPQGSETNVDKVGRHGTVDAEGVSRLVFGQKSDIRR